MRFDDLRLARHVPIGLAGAFLLPVILCGCVANSSSPAVQVTSASMDDRGAVFHLDLDNPGGRDLAVVRLEYEVSHGESGFPVAHGEWTGDVELPAHGRASLLLTAPFETPPLEPDSSRLQLSGELGFIDRTGYLGLPSMDLTRAPFRAEVIATAAPTVAAQAGGGQADRGGPP